MNNPSARGLRLALGVMAAWTFFTGARPTAHAADPPGLAGTWTWTWNDATGQTHRHVLEVEGVDTKLAAREIFDDQPPVRVSNLALEGRSLKFTVVRDQRRADYTGTVTDADHVNGKVTVTSGGQAQEFVWKAERRKDIPK